MLSMPRAMEAGRAGGYFSREDYYLRGAEQGRNSQWCGEGARALGLAGEVSEEDFRALCRGEGPAGNRIIAPKLTRDQKTGLLVETHREGNDCTFSDPKSVSVAYVAGVGGVKEAHDAAVVSVLRHMEEHYSLYRSPGEKLHGNMIVAKFDHATSRNIDPQLHSHCFVLNAVLTPDGSWRANEPKIIYQDLKSLGLLYRQEMVHELKARGLEVVILDRSQMLYELAAVDPRLIEHFSTHRAEIEKQVELWQSEGKFTGVPHGRLFEMAALETRDPKRELTREEVAGIFERGFEACGTSSERVRRELEEQRGVELARQRLPEEPASRVVELAARDLTEREAVLDRARLLDQAVRVSGGHHRISELNAAIDGVAWGMLRIGQDSQGRELYTTAEMRELEAGNLQRVRGLAPFRSQVEEREPDGFFDRLALEGVRLRAGQRKEIVNEVVGRRGLALAQGDPGTAKTSTLGYIERFNEEVLRPTGREHKSINLAYTARAAREMAVATGQPAFTVSSFLNGYATSKFDLQGANGEPARVMVAYNEILIPEGAQVALRVDEASFLGARQAGQLLRVVEDLQEHGVQAKLHLLGDTKQMQAIQSGDFLRQVRDLGERREVDFTHLTAILRQRDQGLLEIARGLNREDREPGENAREALGALEKRGSLVEIADRRDLVAAAVERYLTESDRLSRFSERAEAGKRQSVLMMASSNAERRELNREVREARIRAGEIEDGQKFSVLTPARQGVTVESYQVGDRVVFSGVERGDGKMVRWGARLGTEAEVTSLDRERNLVQLRYSFTTRKKEGREIARTVTRNIPAAEMAGRTTLYKVEERSFSVGDRIIALKNDSRLDLQNGVIGTIRELDKNGKALVDLDGRETVLDLNRYRKVDHAYAVTIPKGQGATLEYSIMFAPVQQAPEHEKERGAELTPVPYGRVSYNVSVN